MGNPTGDDIRYIEMVSQNEWVGLGFNGGFIRTTNAGLSWTSRSDVSGYTGYTPPRIRDGWFFDINNGFAVGSQDLNGLISRTTNGGQTWTNTILPSTTFTSIYFLNNNTGYVVGSYLSSGYKTTNGGSNWTAMSMGATTTLQDVFALDANNIYAVGDKNLYKSTNGGAVWTNASTSASYVSHFSVYFKNTDTGFVAGDAGKFQITTNGGSTWTSRDAPVTDQLMKEMQFNDPEILLVGDENNVFKTTNYGVTWDLLNFTASAPAGNITNAIYSIDRTGSTVVIAGFNGLIYKSANNGNNWSTITMAKHKGYLMGLYASSMTGKIWVVGDAAPNSILYSSNGGASWSSNYGGAQTENFRDVNFFDDNTGYVCGENGSVLRTSNSGLNWSTISLGTEQAANTVETVDENVVLVGCNAGKLFRSTNSGFNFTELQIGTNTVQFSDISFADKNTGWAVMSGSILKSTNKGASWSAQFTHTSSLLGISMIDLNTGYTCGWSGSILKTTNGGTNWNQQASPVPNNITSIDFANASNGFAVSGGGFAVAGSAMRTSNGGASWQIINAGSNPLFKVKAFHGDSAITVGFANILKYSPPSTALDMYLTMNFELSSADTVTVELRSNVAPYNLIESKKGLGGSGVPKLFSFTSISNGTPYFIALKHRNMISTWSSGPVSFNNNTLIYDFTSAASQAYGSNMKNEGGLWSFYQGDVNQDEGINLTDVLAVYNDASNYVSGTYNVSDLNYDGFVDLTDLIPAFNNSSSFIIVRKP
ncbi:MAG: hypothetical protein IPL53_14415 [Ignavibacteria bacterium]|nr:hypothetical protein [Ignavibacteria bacterium]